MTENQEYQDHNKGPASSDLEIDNLPNRLTFFRVLLIPIIIGCLFIQKASWSWVLPIRDNLGWIAGWTFVAASITDFLDGHIARKRNIVTIFGSFLDPIADKFLTVSALIMLQDLGRIPALVVIILVLREFYISSLRLLASNEGLSVPVNFIGKAKTATQMVGVPMLMANAPLFGLPLPLLGIISIYIACFLSIYSSIHYSIGLIKKLKQIKLTRKMMKQTPHPPHNPQ